MEGSWNIIDIPGVHIYSYLWERGIRWLGGRGVCCEVIEGLPVPCECCGSVDVYRRGGFAAHRGERRGIRAGPEGGGCGAHAGTARGVMHQKQNMMAETRGSESQKDVSGANEEETDNDARHLQEISSEPSVISRVTPRLQKLPDVAYGMPIQMP